MLYEVVCTKHYHDIGLCLEKNNKSEPKRVLSRAAYYGSDTEYGGVEIVTWVKTGVFLSKEEWKNVSYNKGTDQILSDLGIKKESVMTNNESEWIMAIDDFENGWGEREYPHCYNCKRGVYRHDAGSWCPFCGKHMKNPMVL